VASTSPETREWDEVLFPASEKEIGRSRECDGKRTKDAMASLDDDEVEEEGAEPTEQ
jgi:hypothetical protein